MPSVAPSHSWSLIKTGDVGERSRGRTSPASITAADSHSHPHSNDYSMNALSQYKQSESLSAPLMPRLEQVRPELRRRKHRSDGPRPRNGALAPRGLVFTCSATATAAEGSQAPCIPLDWFARSGHCPSGLGASAFFCLKAECPGWITAVARNRVRALLG
jgi:hypothetical protein